MAKRDKDEHEIRDESEEDSESDESEDETAELVTTKEEQQFIQTLVKIKQKQPEIYDKSRKFFDSGTFVS